MPEEKFSDGMVIGLLIGVLVGIPLGWMIAQMFLKPSGTGSILFERDQNGLISAIHYVPTGAFE